jgi:HAD superfamily hydrolase (TIGR01509 family)
MPRPVFQAVIFDMDGLVLDSEAGYFLAWQQAASQMGYCLSQAFCTALSGSHGQQISQRLLARFGQDFELEQFYRLSSQIWREQVSQTGIPVKKGFYQALQRIDTLQLPYCLATNSRRDDAEQCLAWAGLDGVFAKLLCREDVQHPKPAADIFLKAAETINIPPQLCLVLEDSPIGVTAAVSAGCTCLFVPSVLPADLDASRLAHQVLPDLFAVADFISAAMDHPL